MRFLLCMLMLLLVGGTMYFTTTEADTLRSSSYLQSDFDVGDTGLGVNVNSPQETANISKGSATVDVGSVNYLKEDFWKETLTDGQRITVPIVPALYKPPANIEIRQDSLEGLILNLERKKPKYITAANLWRDCPFEVGWKA